jgi:hypothetical protein
LRLDGEVQRFAGTISQDTIIDGRWEQKADGKWSPLMTVTPRRMTQRA